MFKHAKTDKISWYQSENNEELFLEKEELVSFFMYFMCKKK